MYSLMPKGMPHTVTEDISAMCTVTDFTGTTPSNDSVTGLPNASPDKAAGCGSPVGRTATQRPTVRRLPSDTV